VLFVNSVKANWTQCGLLAYGKTHSNSGLQLFIPSLSVIINVGYYGVISLLEYATPVWSTHTVADITKIESVQRSFTKRLPGLSNLSYTKHLEVLGL